MPCIVCKHELKIENYKTQAHSGKYFKCIKCLKLGTWQQRTWVNIQKTALPFLLLRNNFPDNACSQEKQDSCSCNSWDWRTHIILTVCFKAYQHKRHNEAHLQSKQRETVPLGPLHEVKDLATKISLSCLPRPTEPDLRDAEGKRKRKISKLS